MPRTNKRLMPNGEPKLAQKDQRAADIEWARTAQPPAPIPYVAAFGGCYENATKRLRHAGVVCIKGQWVFKGEELDPQAEAARVELRDLLDRWLRVAGVEQRGDRIVLRLSGRPEVPRMVADTLYVGWYPKVLCAIPGRGGVVVEVRSEDMAELVAWLKGEERAERSREAQPASAESQVTSSRPDATEPVDDSPPPSGAGAEPGTEALSVPSASQGVGDDK